MKNRVTCSRRTLLMSNLAIFPYRESWVSIQKATAALKYTSGGGAVSSPPRYAPSSHTMDHVLPSGASRVTVACFFMP